MIDISCKGVKVGVIGAMEVEVSYLKELMQADSFSTSVHAGMTFYSGTIETVSVVVCKCNVGKVNAAICTQIMCDLFGVTHIINTGVAGSLDNRINIGDIVVSVDAVQHDVDVNNFGYEYGQIPGLEVLAFNADESLRQIALKSVASAVPNVSAFEGRILSGDQFVRDADRKNLIRDRFCGMCCEMEGAAIAQAAYLNDVPFVIVRAISDKADGSNSESYEEFEKQAAINCAHIITHMLPLLNDVIVYPTHMQRLTGRDINI